MNIAQVLCEIASAGETARATAEAAKVKRPSRKGYTLTERKIAEMLTENTGCHILDSGGAYGRAWQRNQGRDFKSEPATTVEFRVRTWEGKSELEVDVTHNVFHWLVEHVEYDADMTRRFNRYAKAHADEYDLTNMQDFPVSLRDKGHEVGGLYGEGEPICENTYNGECFLSQTLQFVLFTVDDVAYVLLQIHGGADVRGGYTSPKAFRCSSPNGDDGDNFLDYARAGIAPDWSEVKAYNDAVVQWHVQNPTLPGVGPVGPDLAPEGINWCSDGSSWLYDGGSSDQGLDDLPCKEIESRDQWERGVVCVLPDGTGLCPFTGATLSAGFY